jgi:uncharacterized protein YkwD
VAESEGALNPARAFAAALLGVAFVAAAHAQDADQSRLLSLIAQARVHGCPGHAGATAPLHWSAELTRAAPQMEKRGGAALAAAEAQGYRATRVFHADFGGYHEPADVVKAMSQFYCAALTEPKFTDIGLNRRGSAWLVVMAARLDFPQLSDPRAVAAMVLEFTNEARAHARQCGDLSFGPAPPLLANAQLEEVASAHAKDMAQHQYLEHVGRDGSTPAQRISRIGYVWRAVGENIAAGQGSARDVVDDWLSSPGHCENIMNPDFVEMGAAFAVNMASRPVVYWAQEFGKRR